MKVTTIKLKNVYDKEQLYLKIENDNGAVIINIGNKTWENVNKLLNPMEIKNKKEATK